MQKNQLHPTSKTRTKNNLFCKMDNYVWSSGRCHCHWVFKKKIKKLTRPNLMVQENLRKRKKMFNPCLILFSFSKTSVIRGSTELDGFLNLETTGNRYFPFFLSANLTNRVCKSVLYVVLCRILCHVFVRIEFRIASGCAQFENPLYFQESERKSQTHALFYLPFAT